MNLVEALRLAKHAEKTGADAIAAIPPLFFFYDEEDIFQYYRKIAESVSIPVIIYYDPSAQKEMRAKLIARLFEIDNITGVKWSSGNFFEMMKLRELTKGEMNIINGPDELLICGLAAGADAGIGTSYNIMLPQYVALYRLFREGRIEQAREIQAQVNRVIDVMFEFEAIPSVKYAAELMGFDVGNATFPMRQLSSEQKKAFREKMTAAGWTPDLWEM